MKKWISLGDPTRPMSVGGFPLKGKRILQCITRREFHGDVPLRMHWELSWTSFVETARYRVSVVSLRVEAATGETLPEIFEQHYRKSLEGMAVEYVLADGIPSTFDIVSESHTLNGRTVGALQELLYWLYSAVPASPLGAGAAWTEKFPVSVEGQAPGIEVEDHYSLIESQDGIQQVSLTRRSSSPAISGEGMFRFDPEDGLVGFDVTVLSEDPSADLLRRSEISLLVRLAE